MRKALLGLLVLAAVLLCTLVPGTPVNHDPSREATTAGIHLTTPVQHVRAATTAAAPALLVLVVALAALLGLAVDATVAAGDGQHRLARSLLLARAGERRGPPARP